MNVIRHAVFRGLVQGVGFRAFVEREALRHGVGGWVRNRRDASVEAVFAGPPDTVDVVIAACRVGPRAGRVDQADVREGNADELAQRGQGSFSVLPTL